MTRVAVKQAENSVAKAKEAVQAARRKRDEMLVEKMEAYKRLRTVQKDKEEIRRLKAERNQLANRIKEIDALAQGHRAA